MRKLLISALLLAYPVMAQAQSAPSPYTSATRYDAMGRVTGTIAPDPDDTGSLHHLAVRTTYDAAGRPVTVETGELSAWQSEAVLAEDWGTDASEPATYTVSGMVETTYDAMDRKLTERVWGYANGIKDAVATSLTQYSYDAVGRLECTAVRMNPAGYNSLPASACNLGTAGSNGPDRITKTIYDAAGQVLQIRKGVGTSLEMADVTYSYTPNGKIKYVVDANGNKAQLTYDGFDRQDGWWFPAKTGASSFDGSTPTTAMTSAGSVSTTDHEAYTYDANGNRTSLTKRDGKVINYTYDALNRMTLKDIPYSSALPANNRYDTAYEYDLRGLMTKAEFQGGQDDAVIFEFDGFGRKTRETRHFDGADISLNFGYDKNGNRTYIQIPAGAKWVTDYDGLDRPVLLKWGGVNLTDWAYDSAGRVDTVNRGGTSPVQTYGYDTAGRLTDMDFVRASDDDSVSFDFTRNPASQILSQTRDNDAYAWTEHADATRSYTSNGLNQYTAVGGLSYTFDDNGNLTGDGTVSYLYDIENRLVAVTGGGYNTTLRYDPMGRLMLVTDNSSGTSSNFQYDGDNLIYEYDGTGAWQNYFVHGPNADGDDPILWYNAANGYHPTQARQLYQDIRGSVILAQKNNSMLDYAKNTYDEFGIPGCADDPDITGDEACTQGGRFQYTGQIWLPEVGLYYYKARMYSPTLGRFMQTDPIGYEDQFNLYAYVGNDPVNGTDPSGQQASEIVVTAECGLFCTTIRGPAIRTFLESLSTSSRAGPIGIAVWALFYPTELGDGTCPADGCGPLMNEEKGYEGETPDDKPDDYDRLGRPGKKSPPKRNKNDGSVWEADRDGHGGSKWKRWPSVRDWEKNRGQQSIRPDGSIRK